VVQYSRQLMCGDTGISYEEPSPNTFSFNSPYGACPTCKGLGTVYQVSMDAVIPDSTKSINEGGIAPLGEEREAWVFRQVQQLSKKYKPRAREENGSYKTHSLRWTPHTL